MSTCEDDEEEEEEEADDELVVAAAAPDGGTRTEGLLLPLIEVAAGETVTTGGEGVGEDEEGGETFVEKNFGKN